jgi:hypothetical protein
MDRKKRMNQKQSGAPLPGEDAAGHSSKISKADSPASTEAQAPIVAAYDGDPIRWLRERAFDCRAAGDLRGALIYERVAEDIRRRERLLEHELASTQAELEDAYPNLNR